MIILVCSDRAISDYLRAGRPRRRRALRGTESSVRAADAVPCIHLSSELPNRLCSTVFKEKKSEPMLCVLDFGRVRAPIVQDRSALFCSADLQR